MDLTAFVDRLDGELRTADYADIDASPNGLQVGPREKRVEHVAFAVDAAVATIDAAAEADADALVTHHGLIWDGLERVTGRDYDRLARLLEHDLALYVSHLPLDGHQAVGNAAHVGDVIGLDDREPFAEIGTEPIGQRGTLADPRPVEAVAADLEADLETGGRPVQTLDFGPATVGDVAVVTGSGADFLDDAVDAGVDLLVTGEGKQQVYHEAREAGVNVVLAGHYATETGGVRALQSMAEDWGLETTFIEHPTGL